MIETIMITEENQMDLAARFGVNEDFDEMLPIGDAVLFDPSEETDDGYDYDLIQIFNN